MAKIKPTTRKDFVENNSSNCNFDIYCSVQLIIEPLIKSRDFFAALHPMCCSHANQQKIVFMSSANRDRFFFVHLKCCWCQWQIVHSVFKLIYCAFLACLLLSLLNGGVFFIVVCFFFQLNAISSGKRQRFHVPFEMLCVISFLDCGNKIRRLVQRFQVP